MVMKCNYCGNEFKNTAVVNVDWFIMPIKKEKTIIKGKETVAILMNKIACKPCLIQISNGQIKM